MGGVFRFRRFRAASTAACSRPLAEGCHSPQARCCLRSAAGRTEIARKCGGPKPPRAEARCFGKHACAPQASTRTKIRASARAVRRRPTRQNGKSRPQARQASCRRRRTVAGIFDPVRDRRAAGFDPNGFAFCVSGCMGHCAAMAGRSFAPRRPATLASACASQAAARGKAALSTDRMQCVQMAAPSGGELPLV